MSFLTEDRGILELFDAGRFDRPEQRFIAVVTNWQTGEAEYCEKGKCDDIGRLHVFWRKTPSDRAPKRCLKASKTAAAFRRQLLLSKASDHKKTHDI